MVEQEPFKLCVDGSIPSGLTKLSLVNIELSSITTSLIWYSGCMWYVYIFISLKDHLLYTGFTNNLKSRWRAHEGGFVKATKNRRPLKLIYYEAYTHEADARRREKYLKGGKGRGELKMQLKNTFEHYNYKYAAPSSSG